MRKRMSALHDARRVSEDARLNPCGRMAHRSLGGRPSPRCHRDAVVSVLVWSMVGVALWHFTVLVPDKFAGGIIGALLAALAGALLSGYALPSPGVPTANPPGVSEAIWALPGSLLGLAASYVWGSRSQQG
jgi:hypothetical protein